MKAKTSGNGKVQEPGKAKNKVDRKTYDKELSGCTSSSSSSRSGSSTRG